MTRKTLLSLGCVLALAACAAEPPPEPAETADAAETPAAPAGPTFLALHLYNPASEEAHQQFLTALEELNQAVASAGHPETRYTVWKVTGEQAGDYSHMFASLWADRATYDAVHEHEDYKATMARFEEAGIEPFEAELYNRYTLLSPAASSPPLPDATYLSGHLFNLESAEAEGQLVEILEKLNGAIASAGHPGTRYRVWKVTGEQAGEYTYGFGSSWADEAAYDAAHEHADYKALTEQHEATYRALVGDEVHNKYERVQ